MYIVLFKISRSKKKKNIKFQKTVWWWAAAALPGVGTSASFALSTPLGLVAAASASFSGFGRLSTHLSRDGGGRRWHRR